MKFLLVRKYYNIKYIISELYINDKFVTHVKEEIKGNLSTIRSKGEYRMSQFYSARRKRIVYGIQSKTTLMSDRPKFFILQKNGDFNTKDDIKFPYTFSQKKYVLKIS